MIPLAEPVGHERIRTLLREQARKVAGGSDQGLHHAWLFSGPTGVGKHVTARWWASLLQCDFVGQCHPPCESCRLVAGGVHPDVVLTARAPQKSSIGIDDSRAFARSLSLRPTRRGPRVGIIRDADAMTVDAQNALLKLLEEPPGSCVLVLVADNASAMLATVRSRCRHLPFGALDESDVASVLRTLAWEEGQAQAAAACSRGSVSRALAYDAEGLAEREAVLLAFEGLMDGKVEIDAMLQTMMARKESGYALGDLLEWQLAKVERSLGHVRHEPSPDLAAMLERAGGRDSRALLEHASRIEWTISALDRNANARLVIRDLLANVRA
ncbi:MAG TPA: hypothetical protein VEL28_06395 [Candidatus Binatia bacterium]|nr:hypothetical protein [Candidatus Binatia bacterium]